MVGGNSVSRRRRRRRNCAVAFYGIPDPSLADMSSLKKPVLGHFGDKDSMEGFSDSRAADALEAALTSAGSAHTIHRYPGVGHVRATLERPPLNSLLLQCRVDSPSAPYRTGGSCYDTKH